MGCAVDGRAGQKVEERGEEARQKEHSENNNHNGNKEDEDESRRGSW